MLAVFTIAVSPFFFWFGASEGKEGLVNSTDQRDSDSDKQENLPGCSGTAVVPLKMQQSLGCRMEMARDK